MSRLLLLAAILIPVPQLRVGLERGSTLLQQANAAPQPRTPFAGLIAAYLTREADGHSPTADEISAMASLQPAPDAAAVAEAMPYLLRALDNSDPALRSFALTALTGLERPPAGPPPGQASGGGTTATAAAPEAAPVASNLPNVFPAEVARSISPYIAQLAVHLVEESEANRLLTAGILGGFAPDAPPPVYPPLIAYLKRDDAVSPVGFAVVTDLLTLGPISAATADAVSRYLRRPDQTADSRANLADLISSAQNQSQAINKTLLLYLNSDDDSLRARVLLSLPQLDLAPDVFADAKARVEQIANNPNENLQVVTAAKSVAPCWTAPRMPSGCPVYEISK
jgi:hypothetical protein